MISAVVLTHNDEKTIARTLENLKWCDEIILVDDKSTDKTTEIAKKLNAKIFAHELVDDFSVQRNYGLDKAKNDWVLFVDSDEVVSEELKEEILRCVQDDNNINGYYLKRKDWMWGKWLEHGEISKVRLLRLAKKTAGKWIRPIHEVWEVKGQVGELKNPLLHYPHSNVAQFLDEINRYSTVNAHFLYNSRVKTNWWQIVAYPTAKFFVNYFLYLGFLDGTAGAVVAIMMSFHSFLTRSKLWLLWQPKKPITI